MNLVYIIAEAGVNHNGDFNIAKKLIDKAKEVGADAIKFQTFKSENLVSKDAKQADYQKKNLGEETSQYHMLKKLELSYKDFKSLSEYASLIGIDFLSTAFDMDSIDFLNTLDMKYWKIPSGEIDNLPYLEKIASLKKDVILSTGMSDMSEIKEAIEVLQNKGASKISILHCTTEYPAPFEEVNLLAMQEIENKFGVEIGYSDHTKGIEVPIAAVALGAKIIEKHFTLDKNMEGPDHKASLEPDEFEKMVKSIRNVEISLGKGEKAPTKSEMKNKKLVRKSIVAKRAISEGEVFDIENITTKRPSGGISPMKWYSVIGQRAKRKFEKDEMIEL